MTTKLRTLLLTAALIGLNLAADGATRAATISDLAAEYQGTYHHNTNAASENRGANFPVLIKDASGKFTAEFDGLPVSGKVTSTGKVTFAGSFTNADGFVKIKAGKGQLSATGRFIIGSFKIQTNIEPELSGGYTFELEAEN